MKLEERLERVLEMQRINEKQISNREKSMELAKKLEEDIENERIRLELKKLEIEYMSLYKRHKELVSKL